MNCNKRIAKFIQKLKDKITPPSKDKYELVTLVNDGLTPDEFYEWAKTCLADLATTSSCSRLFQM